MSNNTMPSMAALLGLLAVAGYKNRDKISEMLNSAKDALPTPQAGETMDNMFGTEQAAGDNVSGGLKDLMDQFNNAGHKDAAESWVGQGNNQQVAPNTLEQVLGSNTLNEIAGATGLSVQDILSRLSTNLPNAVDGMTPEGRLPNAQEARRFR